MRRVDWAVPLDDAGRLFPPFHGIVGIEAARDRKHVFGIVPDFIFDAARTNEESALAAGLPLAAGKYQNRDVLVAIVGLPQRMPEDNQRAVFRPHNLVRSRRIGLPLPLLDQHGIPPPTG